MRCPRRPRLQPGSHRAKKLAAILMVGAATAACGSSGGSGSTTTTAAAKTSTTAAASSTTASSSSSSSSSSSTTAKSSTGGSRVNLTFWEAMGGALGQTLQHLVSQFNASQSTYKVTAVYKGSYSTTMSDTIAAFRAHKAPDIAQIFDAGTTTFMASKGAYEPVWQIMKKNNIPFSTSDFIGGAASYYETAANKLDSLPFNSSTPVLYYNKALLKKAGISGPPKTWEDLAADAPKLVQAGAKCVYSPSGAYIMWTDLEEFAVWNAYQYASQDNGYQSIQNVKLNIDSAPFVKHMTLLGQLAQHHLLMWSGVKTTTVPYFTKGTCAFYANSSGDIAEITKAAKFPFGVTELPTVAGDSKAPQNTVVGGASLWVMAGTSASHYKGDAEFLHFMMSTPSMEYWAKNTGYVPVTNASSKALKQAGFYKSHTADLVAVNELNNKPPLPYTRGIRLGFLPKVRDAEVTAFSSVFSGKATAAQALKTAQTQGDQILAQFASQYGH